jgi:hypothetical protein
MSVEVIVYVCDSELPSRDEWQRAIDGEGIDLQLDEFSPREHTGFLPAKLDGQDCGFEYFFEPVNEAEAEEVLAEIGGRDRRVAFVCHSSQIEGRAAMLAAAVLTKLADGVFLDPQGPVFARGDRVFAMIEEEERAAWDARMQLAERKWGCATSRRCPKCQAPCPEYKNKCAVCGFMIGRT